MSEFSGNPFSMQESICVTVSSGRHFVPKDTENKETSKAKKILIYAALSAAALIVVAFVIFILSLALK